MKPDATWSRRTFLQGAGCVSALGVLGRMGIAQPLRLATSMAGFAYVGSASTSQVHVFAVHGNRWSLRQSIASRSPSFLAIHPNQRFLYAANDIEEHHGLPRGTVEAYEIHGNDGQLTLLNRQPLSLSGTRPQHLAVSPDGRTLVAAVYGGGAYNVLPIAANGALGDVTGILKEVGSGPHPELQRSAHPHTVVFDKAGKYIFGSDQGCDRLKVFALQHGKLECSQQISCRQGAGPGHMVMHHSRLYVSAADGSITGYRLDTNGHATEICRVQSPSAKSSNTWSRGALIIPPSGDFIYASDASGITAWTIDPATGTLSHCHTWRDGATSVGAMISVADGSCLLAVDRRHDRVIKIDMDHASGKLGEAEVLASVAGPASLAMQYT